MPDRLAQSRSRHSIGAEEPEVRLLEDILPSRHSDSRTRTVSRTALQKSLLQVRETFFARYTNHALLVSLCSTQHP